MWLSRCDGVVINDGGSSCLMRGPCRVATSLEGLLVTESSHMSVWTHWPAYNVYKALGFSALHDWPGTVHPDTRGCRVGCTVPQAHYKEHQIQSNSINQMWIRVHKTSCCLGEFLQEPLSARNIMFFTYMWQPQWSS